MWEKIEQERLEYAYPFEWIAQNISDEELSYIHKDDENKHVLTISLFKGDPDTFFAIKLENLPERMQEKVPAYGGSFFEHGFSYSFSTPETIRLRVSDPELRGFYYEVVNGLLYDGTHTFLNPKTQTHQSFNNKDDADSFFCERVVIPAKPNFIRSSFSSPEKATEAVLYLENMLDLPLYVKEEILTFIGEKSLNNDETEKTTELLLNPSF